MASCLYLQRRHSSISLSLSRSSYALPCFLNIGVNIDRDGIYMSEEIIDARASTHPPPPRQRVAPIKHFFHADLEPMKLYINVEFNCWMNLIFCEPIWNIFSFILRLSCTAKFCRKWRISLLTRTRSIESRTVRISHNWVRHFKLIFVVMINWTTE